MADQQLTSAQSHVEPKTNAAPIAVPVETVPLNTVLASIMRDSKKAAGDYLNQVHVPHGGE